MQMQMPMMQQQMAMPERNMMQRRLSNTALECDMSDEDDEEEIPRVSHRAKHRAMTRPQPFHHVTTLSERPVFPVCGSSFAGNRITLFVVVPSVAYPTESYHAPPKTVDCGNTEIGGMIPIPASQSALHSATLAAQ